MEQVKETVNDEVCPNAEYFTQLEKSFTKKCSIQPFPVKQGDIDSFRDSVEKYLKQRQDVIEKVIDCKVENAGRNVRLESIVKRDLWKNFFNDPVANYGDLPGVKRVLHDCTDLANCDRLEA